MTSWVRLPLRALHVTALFWVHGLFFIMGWLGLRLSGRSRERRLALLGRVALHLFRSLGATFIKIGQFLSTRGDLLPRPVRAALAELQDRVGPFPFARVRATLEEELGEAPEAVFAELDPYPLASASISQVHRGRLADGRQVAVKVLRPAIEATVRLDVQVIRFWARLLALLPWLRHFEPCAIVDEFASAVWLQLDLRTEAENNRRFAANFASDPAIGVPWLVDELCTQRVLCMELITGVRINGPDWDPALGERLARVGFRALLQMIFSHGFVHADLHPGNLIVTGDRVVLLDLGLVARLTPERREGLARLFGAWAGQDPARVAAVMLELVGAEGAAADAAAFEREVAALVDRYRSAPLAEVQLGLVFLELARLLRRQRVRLEPGLTMVLVAIAVVEGVGRDLAPRLDLVREALGFFTAWTAAQRPRASAN